ncbi:MAG TPA: DUF1552 domain-containing protein [Gemmatimonadetes bacterium]|nr:DUF1552 domain-containing protein [Gemmatimonadota bacterium]
MDFITGKHISRRAALRGMGATVALPFLDAMVPAGKMLSSVDGLSTSLSATRLIAIEMVHGAAGSNEYGESVNLWSPADAGHDFDLTPTSLLSLEPYRDYLTIISNTDVEPAEATTPPEIGGDHFRSSAVFLTQTHPKQTEGSDVLVGTSLDQLYAQRFGQDTPIPSMQLCIENINQSGGCAYGYTCVYTDSISWASPTEPLPVIRDPRVVFEQLFGAGGTAEERTLRRRTDSSILDWITGRVGQLKRELGAADQQKLERYLEDVREIERRISLVESRNSSGESRELPEAPAGVPDSFSEHAKLMFDLQLLAFESDVTRVFSFKMGRDSSARVFPESGSEKPFHPASHHGGNEESVREFAKINSYHVSMIPYFLERLKNTVEGDATLLDKTMLIYGSPMGDPNLHNHKRCPLFVVGGANGALAGNNHIFTDDGTPMANAMLSLGQKLGFDEMTSFGNSTGPLELNV